MQARAEEVFLTILARFTAEGRFVSDAKKGNYAPRLFAEEARGKDGRRSPCPTWRGPCGACFKASGCGVGKSKDGRKGSHKGVGDRGWFLTSPPVKTPKENTGGWSPQHPCRVPLGEGALP